MNKIKNIYFFLFLFLFNTLFNTFQFFFNKKIKRYNIHNYKIHNYIKILKKKKLSKELSEISGIQYIDGYFWCINDSENEAKIYQLDPINFKIRFVIKLPKSIKNIDWEDITFDKYNKNLYISDTGNNSGNRFIQIIYIINLNKINYKNPKKFCFLLPNNNLKKIKFVYPKKNKLNVFFNCESILYYNNKIHIFTKEKKKTTHYIIPSKPGFYKAKMVETLKNIKGLITGSDINIKNKEIFMTEYNDKKVYLCRFWNFKDYFFFNGNKQEYYLGNLDDLGLVEGITIKNKKIFITNEVFNKYLIFTKKKQHIYEITLER